MLGWLPDILPFHVVLFILAAVTGLYASLIQKYTMDWEFLRNSAGEDEEAAKKYERSAAIR